MSFERKPPDRATSKSFFAVTSVASVALEAEIEECHLRLLSGEIIMSTAASNNQVAWNKSRREISVRPFVEAFEKERSRIEGVLCNHRQTIDSSVEALLKDADGLVRRKEHGKLSNEALFREAKTLRRRAKGLQTKTLKTIGEATKNQKELHRIALKADAKLRTNCAEESDKIFAREPWTDTGSAGHIVKLLSDIFSLIRETEEDVKAKDDKWVAPSSFERVTTKYWVREEDLPEVLLKSASELPLLVYGKSGLLTKNPKDPSQGGKTEFWKSMASPISSVYFDSDEMSLYKERLKRSEGAQLVRVRWYGAKKPKNDAVLFLELKTHHECWIDNQSLKERVSIVQHRMKSLIDISDGPWTTAFAETIVKEALEGNESVSQEEIAASTDLLLEIRSLFVKFRLKPCVRTSYIRAAFQNPNSNDLRLTLDRDITVIDETRNTGTGWCIEDNDVVPIDAFIKVPYGVFEVKVSNGENPLFVEELIGSDAIVEAPKFSKFLTGASLHNVTKVETLPWWSEDELFAPMFKMRTGLPSHSVHSGMSTAGRSLRDLVDPTRDTSMNQFMNIPMEIDSIDIEVPEGDDDELSAMENGEQPRFSLGVTRPSRRESATDSTKSSRRESAPEFSRRSSINSIFLDLAAGLRNRSSKQKSVVKKAAPRSPARVEPKSFFANERTFIQWITVGSMFMFVAGLVYTLGLELGSSAGAALMQYGNFIVACAIVIVFYGTFIYYRRLNLMINAKPYGYNDSLGPAMLSLFVIGLLFTFIFISMYTFPQSNKKLVSTPGVCVKRNLDLGSSSGITALQFEPSAVIIDESRDLMLVASLDEIVALPAGLPTDEAAINAPFKVLYRFEEDSEDLEALEIINGTIYALSESREGDDHSEVIELEWTNEGLLNETGRYRIKSPNSEGMAYTDDPSWFRTPRLMVAGDYRTIDPAVRLKMSGFAYPFQTNGKTHKMANKRSNEKFFINGVEDSKISSMQFFGGNLYTLYNNEKIIRAYDSLGTIINTWNLPVGEIGFDEYWEGMRLQQDGNDLYLHLTLDSPPQIWTIKLEGETAGFSPTAKWSLPACAA